MFYSLLFWRTRYLDQIFGCHDTLFVIILYQKPCRAFLILVDIGKDIYLYLFNGTIKYIRNILPCLLLVLYCLRLHFYNSTYNTTAVHHVDKEIENLQTASPCTAHSARTGGGAGRGGLWLVGPSCRQPTGCGRWQGRDQGLPHTAPEPGVDSRFIHHTF